MSHRKTVQAVPRHDAITSLRKRCFLLFSAVKEIFGAEKEDAESNAESKYL